VAPSRHKQEVRLWRYLATWPSPACGGRCPKGGRGELHALGPWFVRGTPEAIPTTCHPGLDPGPNPHPALAARWIPCQARDDSVVESLDKTATCRKLIPAPQPYAILPSSAAPKRDHDEWLVRWRLGGAGSLASGPSQSRYGQFLSFGTSRVSPVPNGAGGSNPANRSDPTGGCDHVGPKRPVSAATKPKTPAGRRGASLIYLRTTAPGLKPRRPRFTCPPTRGGDAGGGGVMSRSSEIPPAAPALHLPPPTSRTGRRTGLACQGHRRTRTVAG
jgi:hypothetical protein